MRSRLSTGVDDEDVVDAKKRQDELRKLASDIATEDTKIKEEMKIRGMIYFNTASGDVLQVLEGKPLRLVKVLTQIVRDIRHDRLKIEVETYKVKPRFKTWGKAWATTAQQWKIVRLMLPTESDWARLAPSLADDATAAAARSTTTTGAAADGKRRLDGQGRDDEAGARRRDSLQAVVERKRPIFERLGADCKRVWQRRESICTKLCSNEVMRYFRDLNKGMIGQWLDPKPKPSLFGCMTGNPAPRPAYYPPGLYDSKGRHKIMNRDPRREDSLPSRSRISIARQSILDRLNIEDNGFVINLEDTLEQIENLKAQKDWTPERRYVGPDVKQRPVDSTGAATRVRRNSSSHKQASDAKVNVKAGEAGSTKRSPSTSPPPRQPGIIAPQNSIDRESLEKVQHSPLGATSLSKDSELSEMSAKAATASALTPAAARNETKIKAAASSLTPPQQRSGARDSKRVWRLVQAIGPDESAVAASTSQDDYVTSLQLDPDGMYIAIGDSQGRIGVFDASETYQSPTDPYQFYEEFVSHHPDFDTLYSRRIPTNIIAVEWLKKQSRSLHVLATNEKTIKLWRLKEVKKDQGQIAVFPVLAKDYEKGHQRFFIHSLSAVCDGETFLSADELVLNMWHLEYPERPFCLIDDLPEDDIVEVNRIITSAKASPVECHRFLYTTSVNEVNLCDLRQRCLQNRPSQVLQGRLKLANMTPDVKRELQCITDADFSFCGNYVVTRSFSAVRIWDLRRTGRPQQTITVHEDNPSLFSELCTSGCLVDDFRVAVNRDCTGVVTGSYDDYFVAFDLINGRKNWMQARHSHDTLRKETPRMTETGRKVLHVDWHNHRDIITVASSHSVYVFEQSAPDWDSSREVSSGRF